MRLALIHGGRSGEHDVSRASAGSILDHLDREVYQVTELLIGRDGQWHVDGAPVPLTGALHVIRSCDVVFPAMHGPYGEDGRLQALLEWLGVAYVGNGVFASAAGMDKAVTKKLLVADGLRVAGGITLDDGEETVPPGTPLPVFVKPARSGSSLGVSRVTDRADLPAAVRLARIQDRKVLVEQAVPGREVDVAVLQYPDGRLVAGPPLEITVAGGFFDYAAKYDGGAVFQIPAMLDDATTRLLQDRAIQVFRALDCWGLLRVDFFVPDPGATDPEPVVNEVNTFPGMTAASQFPQMWKHAGLSFPELLDVLIATAADSRRRLT
ncbi:D-alanine--D-alanine ligase family protein [Actinoplanes couchii]|uniref:D-alanine--D-alanine ligase n=1 Tax=Actinoplanes couchii TaxID=403638 RepID=A0ABQ3XKQ3_9ACTN|nr:D-alanine--D-alanine ligase family protein [Actinoplanes couchii]MDR6319532.1 D-alanine-D-alanine ligase [Actinoplanes couchii]GID59078.1 D-alanine--D-alanine ligase [Actinoplanes couchii]